MAQEEGITIIMSPVQLAAVLKNGTISEAETLNNRLWGGMNIVGGVVELLGAGALCAAPEPTMATKVGCVVLGIHGLDAINTGGRQVMSGRVETSATQQAASGTAKIMGAAPQTANSVGLNVDIAVGLPFGMVKGAAKVGSVNSGKFSLIAHEATASSKAGGHTILKHVGKTEAELRMRLKLEPDCKVASSFLNLSMAEQAVSQALQINSAAILAWSKNPSRPIKLAFDAEIGTAIGHSVARATQTLTTKTGVRVVLKYETYNGMPYYVLTAFPI